MAQNKLLKVVVLSSTAFGYRCLNEGILETSGVKVVGILTTPPQISYSHSGKTVSISTHVNFVELAKQAGCEVVEMCGKMTATDYLEPIKRWHPDLMLVLGWYFMIPRKVRDAVSLGCAGIHASLLPKYRGGAPITWAIINGETKTGISFFYIVDGVDKGNIIAQRELSIEDNDNCATVYEKVTQTSIKVLREYLPQIATGNAPSIVQDGSQATQFPMREPKDGEIDWSWSAKRIRDFIRAQTKPYPGAFTYIGGKKITIWDADVNEFQ